MFSTFEQVRKYIQEEDIQMVDLKFCDLWGRWRHLTIPAARFTSDIMRDGVGFDGSSVGLKSVKAGDMVTVPELQTAFRDPFWKVPTISFIGYTLEADIYSWTPDQLSSIKPLPASLKEALEALQSDNEFLLHGDVFDDELIGDWIAFKLESEYYQVRNRPHPYEMKLYFDTLRTDLIEESIV